MMKLRSDGYPDPAKPALELEPVDAAAGAAAGRNVGGAAPTDAQAADATKRATSEPLQLADTDPWSSVSKLDASARESRDGDRASGSSLWDGLRNTPRRRVVGMVRERLGWRPAASGAPFSAASGVGWRLARPGLIGPH